VGGGGVVGGGGGARGGGEGRMMGGGGGGGDGSVGGWGGRGVGARRMGSVGDKLVGGDAVERHVCTGQGAVGTGGVAGRAWDGMGWEVGLVWGWVGGVMRERCGGVVRGGKGGWGAVCVPSGEPRLREVSRVKDSAGSAAYRLWAWRVGEGGVAPGRTANGALRRIG